MAEDDMDLAKWTRAFINGLPNSAFAVIEPDFLSGKTEDKNARHLPYKGKDGKVDIPHLRNALARMNQIKPVTDSISADELRAKAKRKLVPLAKKHLPDSKWAKEGNKKKEASEEMDLMLLSTDRPVTMEFLENESTDEYDVYKYELIDDDTFNGIYFGADAVRHQHEKFHESDFIVSHGMDHSREMLDQLGQVFDMTLKEDGDKVRAFVKSKIFKETPNQKQFAVLMRQGLATYISGGWKAKVIFNDDMGRFEVHTPELREVSSTPTPAKKDAKLQNVLNSLIDVLNEDITYQAPILEELEMTDDPDTPPVQGAGEDDQLPPEPEQTDPKPELVDSEALAIAKENAKILKELKEKNEEEARNRAIEKGVELGLDPTKFEGMTAPEIERAIGLVNDATIKLLAEKEPDVSLGGGSAPDGVQDGTPEMADHLLNAYFPHLLDEDQRKDVK